MDKKKIVDGYITKDLAEASFLLASGIKLVQIKDEDSRFWFAFADKATCQRLTDSFWRREAMVNAQELCTAMRTLKDIIYRKRQR